MGMFDSVIVDCKNRDCDAEIEFQSKAGPCQLNRYNVEAVPLIIAEDINGKRVVCRKCQCETTLTLNIFVPKVVEMQVH